VIHTDPRQAGDLGIREYLLARFYGNHGFVPYAVFLPYRTTSISTLFDAIRILNAAIFQEQ
jgi:hypothetical protein